VARGALCAIHQALAGDLYLVVGYPDFEPGIYQGETTWGGWGPLVTSTLIAKGKTPQYVIGTVSLTEFFVTFASAVTFFSVIGLSHWVVIAGLLIGGVVAAPISARLAGKLPVRTMFILVGIVVVFWSLRILWKVW
jgi:uncharacterized membrane protein YfcA